MSSAKRSPVQQAWAALTSLKVTIAALAVMMVLVVGCTLAQVQLGTLGAVNAYIRTWFVWWAPSGTNFAVPVFPGGVLAGLVLLVNLVAVQLKRLELSWRKSGMWLIHFGLVLLVVGEFITALVTTESRLAIEQGQTLSWVERPHEFELAVIDQTDPQSEGIYAVPEPLLRAGGTVALPNAPLALDVKRYVPNASLRRRGESDPQGLVDRGVGTGVVMEPRPVETRDDAENSPAVIVEPVAGGTRMGTWLVSTSLGAPQTFMNAGRTFRLELRHRREQLPYSITLKKFSHDVYPGTDIPKNFSSLVQLSNPAEGELRDVLISMNQPLRYKGKAFYQASFGRGDTLSILQVVDNPGWLIPYASCVLVTIGLIVHFGMALRRGVLRARTGPAAVEAAPAAAPAAGGAAEGASAVVGGAAS